jgi:hypothetical protein
VKALISVEVSDEFLQQRVAEFNAERAPDEAETTPHEYMTNVIRDLVVEDSLPITLFTWPAEVKLVEVAPSA